MRLATVLVAILPALGPTVMPGAALAACANVTFVSCQVENGKMLEVCINPADFAVEGSFTYSFGPASAPEIELSVPMAAFTVQPWSGVGRSIWAGVGFPNDDVTYVAWNAFDRLDQEAGMQGGVDVMQNDSLIASFACQPGGTVAPVFTLEDQMAAAGFCWNLDNFAWQRGNCG